MANKPDLSFLDNLGESKQGQQIGQSTLAGVLESYGQIFIDATKKNLDDTHGNATHKLWQSIVFNVEVIGMNYNFSIAMEDYWRFKDEGRGPGKKPPLKPIIEWIFNKPDFKAKLGGTRKGMKNMKMAKFGDISAPAPILAAALGIQRKIGKKGTKPSNFVSEVLTDEFIANLKSDIELASGKYVEISIEQIKKEINGNNHKPAARYL